MSDRERGLYQKYIVERIHDPARKHIDCNYFVLDLTVGHDPFVAAALRTYAMGCRAEYPLLFKDLLDIVGKLDEANLQKGVE